MTPEIVIGCVVRLRCDFDATCPMVVDDVVDIADEPYASCSWFDEQHQLQNELIKLAALEPVL